MVSRSRDTDVRTRHDYRPIWDRPALPWPDGARLAVYVGLNIEYYEPGRPSVGVLDAVANRNPDPINEGWREYGPRVGVWRTAELLDELGIRPSVLVNSDVCAAYPQLVAEGVRRGWCWVAHGKNNSQFAGPKPPQLPARRERAYLRDVLGTIETATGARPHGWLGPLGLSQTPNTVPLLGELGVDYVLDWASDDQPYRLDESMLAVPYTFEVNDLPLFLRNGASGPDLARMIVDQFDVLYAESARVPRVMSIALHPFVAGQPFRHGHLADALRHITSFDDVWLTTSDEIADWYRKTEIQRTV